MFKGNQLKKQKKDVQKRAAKLKSTKKDQKYLKIKNKIKEK